MASCVKESHARLVGGTKKVPLPALSRLHCLKLRCFAFCVKICMEMELLGELLSCRQKHGMFMSSFQLSSPQCRYRTETAVALEHPRLEEVAVE
jgi:hypothetical protein